MLEHVLDKDKKALSEFIEKCEIDIDDLCIDNHRVFPEHMQAEYDEMAYSGCCGFFDTKFTGPSGQIYLVGFNYGH